MAALVLAAWAVAGAVSLVQGVRHAEGAQATLRALRADLSAEALADGTASRHLDSLRDELRAAERSVRSAWVLPWRVVPGVGRHLRAAAAMSDAGQRLASVAADLTDDVRDTVGDPLPRGQERLALIERFGSSLGAAEARLAGIDLGPGGPLYAPLARARTDLEEGLSDLRAMTADGQAAAASIGALLSSGDHLLLVGNNAEMRAGSGTFLQVGSLVPDDGALRVDDLRPAGALRLPPGAVRPDPVTYGRNWGFLRAAEEWRNLGASPRFDVTAELAARMWVAGGQASPDNVVAVDPFVVQALLRATGPVVVDDRRLGADDVVGYLLNGQYRVFQDAADARSEAQALRRDRLGELVRAALEALDGEGVDGIELVDGLRDAVRGRHLLAWSPDPEVQAGWVAAGMAGTLEVESMMVSLLNRGANKLDPFVQVDAVLESDGAPAADRWAELEITVRNEVPDGQVPYVAGPNAAVEAAQAYGDYVGFLAVTLPGVARDAHVVGVTDLLVAGPDGPTLTVATRLRIPRSEQRRFTVRFRIPAGFDAVVIEPDARPRPVRWTVGDRSFRAWEPHRVPVP